MCVLRTVAEELKQCLRYIFTDLCSYVFFFTITFLESKYQYLYQLQYNYSMNVIRIQILQQLILK